MQLLTLTAIKVKEISGLYKGYDRTELYQDGVLYATIPASAKQPRRGQKTVTINCFKWAVIWPANS